MENHLVVGSQARILYADAEGRIKIAEAFNKAIAAGEISAPVILGRDHHDVSGTDSPYRETSNIYDGSRFTADYPERDRGFFPRCDLGIYPQWWWCRLGRSH